jgi:gliding motility-associatede transport system auxiliary component
MGIMTAAKTERWKQGSLLTGLTLVFLAILVVVSLLVYRFPWRLDLTEGKRNSISSQTQKIVKSLKQDVWIRAFFQEGNPGKKKAQALFETYAYANPRIHYQFIDPDRQPSLAQQYGVRNYGALILESGGKTQPVNVADEEGITNGLLRLMQPKAKTVVFLSGHGERSIRDSQKTGYSLARSLLIRENYQVEEMNLLSGTGLPAETRCVVIAGPKKPFFPQEVEDLKKYVQAGGRLILLLEPYQDGGFKEWLASLGVNLNEDIVIDKLSRAFGGDYLIPMAGSYGENPITEKFNVATFFPTARSLNLSPSPPPKVSYDVLVNSSSGSWAEFNRKELEKGKAAFDSGQDRKGPLPLAVLVTLPSPEQKTGSDKKPGGKETKSPKGQIALFGDSDFAGNGYFNLSGNGDLFLNTVNYLTEEEALIAIRPAKTPVRPLSLSYSQAMVLFWVPMVLLPVLVIGAGIWVWRSRRKAR